MVEMGQTSRVKVSSGSLDCASSCFEDNSSLAGYYKKSDFPANRRKFSKAVGFGFTVSFGLSIIEELILILLICLMAIYLDVPFSSLWQSGSWHLGIGVSFFVQFSVVSCWAKVQDRYVALDSDRKLRKLKFIWSGSGQTRFSCGQNGLMICSQQNVAHLIKWEKISHIYVENNFGYIENLIEKLVAQDSSYAPFLIKARELVPPCLGKSWLGKEPKKLSNNKAIRFRLFNSQYTGTPAGRDEKYVEELVVPFRFFRTGNDLHSVDKFIEDCLFYRFGVGNTNC